MLKFINELTDTLDWQRKVFDADFVFTWKSAKLVTEEDVTPAMVDWVF